MTDQTFRTPKSSRTFETVLRVATDLFGRQGYHNTTIRDIARESGLGLGGLYYYVRSKEELVMRFYERINQQISEDCRHLDYATVNLSEALAAFLRLKLVYLTPYRDLLKVVMKEAIDPDSALCPLNPASSRHLSAGVALFREMIERTGAAAGLKAEEMARGLWMAHMGILVYWLHDRSAEFQATHRAIDTLAAFVRWSSRAARIPGLGSLQHQVYSLIFDLFPPELMEEQSHADKKR